MTITEEYALQYWHLGNIITGFVVIQAMAVMFYVGTSPEFVKNMGSAKLVVIPLIIGFHIIYAIVIWYCFRIEQSFLSGLTDQARHRLWMTLLGRWMTVAVFASLLIGVTVAVPTKSDTPAPNT